MLRRSAGSKGLVIRMNTSFHQPLRRTFASPANAANPDRERIVALSTPAVSVRDLTVTCYPVPGTGARRIVNKVVICVGLLGLFTLTACGGSEPSQDSTTNELGRVLEAQQNTTTLDLLDLDIPWKEINSLSNDRLLHAFAQFEVETRAIRTLGLELWRSEPNNPARFEWLLLTTLAPPAYALEPTDWVWDTTWRTVLPSAVDDIEISRWNKEFATMREEYLASPAVGEETKHLFQFVELWSGFNLRHRMHGENVKFDPLLFDKLLEFGRAYRTPLHQDDRKWAAYMQTLVADVTSSIVFENNVFRITDNELEQFLQFCNDVYTLDHLFHDICVKLNDHRLDLDPDHVEGLPVYRRPQGYSSLLQLPGMSWPFPSFSGSDHPVPTLGAFNRARLDLQNIRAAEAGIIMFRENSEVTLELTRWTNAVRGKMPYIGAKHFFRASPSDGPRYDGIQFDALNSDLHLIERSIASSGLFDGDSLATYEFGAARALRDLAIQQYENDGSNRVGIEYLDKMEELYRRYGRRLGASAFSEDIILSTDIIDFYYKAGIPEPVANDFLLRFRSDDDSEIRNWSHSIENLASKRNPPWEFETTTIDDTPFALSELRGNIVFVDVWASTCSSCIYKMPDKHELYQEYKDRGLEVVSFMADLKDQKKLAERIIKRHGLEWETVDGQAEWLRMQSAYGLLGMPKYFVIDRNGLMIGSPSELKSSLVRVREVIDSELSGGG